jgi:DNA-binding phage protein
VRSICGAPGVENTQRSLAKAAGGVTRAGDISTVAKDGGTGRQTMLVVTITTT